LPTCPKVKEDYNNKTSVLTDEQRAAMNSIEDYSITVITGGPGVGKTFVAKEIFKKYGHDQTRLIAYTGALVSHLRQVIASTLELGLNDSGTGSGDDRDRNHSSKITKIVHMVHGKYYAKHKHRFSTSAANSPSQSQAMVRVVIIDELPMFDNRTLAMALSLYTDTQTRLVFLADENQIGAIGLGSVFAQFKNYYNDQYQTVDEATQTPPTKLINFCGLTQNFRQSHATQELKDLLHCFADGTSSPLFLRSSSSDNHSGVKYLEIPQVSNQQENNSALFKVISGHFTNHTQNNAPDLSLYYNTMFLTLRRDTQRVVNSIISSIVLAQQKKSESRGTSKATYYIGQRVMIDKKNFHANSIDHRLQLFNGEVYIVDKIVVPPSPTAQQSIPSSENTSKNKGDKADVVDLLRVMTTNSPACQGIISDFNSAVFGVIGAMGGVADQNKAAPKMIIIKLKKWPSSPDPMYKYAMVLKGGPSGLLDTATKLLIQSLNGCPLISVNNLVESWAMTVNKAQGCEFDRACLVIRDGTKETKDFTPGHGLVAISRAKQHFTFIAHSPDILDRMWGVISNNEKELESVQSSQSIRARAVINKKEPLSDFKTYLLSPDAPWNNNNLPTLTRNTGGIKRSSSAMN
jgi:nucleoside-triphosphatase THEP1